MAQEPKVTTGMTRSNDLGPDADAADVATENAKAAAEAEAAPDAKVEAALAVERAKRIEAEKNSAELRKRLRETQEKTEAKTTKAKPQVVFLALTADHPSQIVSYSRHKHTEGGTTYPGKSISIDEEMIGGNFTGRFVLKANAQFYDEQLDALRRICADPNCFPLVELKKGEEGIVPEYMAAKTQVSAKDMAIDAQRKLDETSDLLTKEANARAEAMEELEKVRMEKKALELKLGEMGARVEALESKE